MHEQKLPKNPALITPLAGWPMRSWSLMELERYLDTAQPYFLEISKYLVEGQLSIKEVAKLIHSRPEITVSYAGTTNLIDCADFTWDNYLKYVNIQVAQACFLGSHWFRVFIGGGTEVSTAVVTERVNQLCSSIAPMRFSFEIHGGWEREIPHLYSLLTDTPACIVIDFENTLSAGLSYEKLHKQLPPERIAYFHSRNIAGFYEEHPESLSEEELWCSKFPDIPVLWEPKRIVASKLIEFLYGTESSY